MLRAFLLLLFESSARLLKEEAKSERPVCLDDVEILVGKPAPATLGISCDRGIVRVSCGKLSLAVVDKSVYPHELSVGVHLCYVFVAAELAVLRVKEHLCADIVDVSRLEHLVETLVLLDDGEIGYLGRVGLDYVEEIVTGSGLYYYLVFHIVLADKI